MKTYCFLLAYDGTRYRGWQRQENTEHTIQAKLEGTLSRMTGHRIEIHGAGRTDAGVHASGQVASSRFTTDKTAQEIRQYLNQYLPDDIAVLSCCEAPERFHARLNATGKQYRYCVNDTGIPDVFRRRYVCSWPHPLNENVMREAAAMLCGQHDFRGFSSVGKRFRKSTVRTVSSIEILRTEHELQIVFQGDGFLYNMVRILAGTLVEIGEGSRSLDTISTVFHTLNRQHAGQTLPAQGLTLEQVFFSQPLWVE